MAHVGLAVFGVLLAVAAASDMVRYRIPNWLTAALATAGVVAALPLGPEAWLVRAASVALIGAGALALYLGRALGGGDVKLLAAAAVWMPFASLPAFLALLALAGGGQAAFVLAQRRLAAPGGAAARAQRMPYAVSIAAAGLAWAAWRWAAT